MYFHCRFQEGFKRNKFWTSWDINIIFEKKKNEKYFMILILYCPERALKISPPPIQSLNPLNPIKLSMTFPKGEAFNSWMQFKCRICSGNMKIYFEGFSYCIYTHTQFWNNEQEDEWPFHLLNYKMSKVKYYVWEHKFD